MNNLFSFVAGIAVGATAAWLVFRYKQTKKIEDEYEIIEAEADAPEEPEELAEEYETMIRHEDYSADAGDYPYVIPPEEFGELEGFKKVSLTYYSDEVLTDEDCKPLLDVDAIIGHESLYHFGDYEDDSVYVRNERLKCDFEVLLDHRRYDDVRKNKKRPKEDE